jgi:hypothetical protein
MESVDKTQNWTKVRFESTDAVQVIETARDGKQIRGIRKLKPGEQLSSSAVVIKNGWDHEHCELCWTHVDPGDYAYRNERDSWLCLNCFEERGAK